MTRSLIALPLLAAFAMAIDGIIVELFYVTLHTPTLVVAMIAVPIAGAILFVMPPKGNLNLLRTEWKAILLLLGFFTITEFTWYSAISEIGAIKTQLIQVPLETICVIILALIFLQERFDRFKILGAALTVAGVIIAFNVTTTTMFGIGEILIALASISGAITVIIITRLLRKYDTKQVTAFSLLFSGLILQLQWFFVKPQELEWSWYLLLTPVIPLAVFFLQNLSYKRVGASLSSVIMTTHVIIVIALQAMLFYLGALPVLMPENLLLAFIGGTVSIGGIVILERD